MMKAKWMSSISNQRENAGLAMVAGPRDRVCPSDCPSDWDKRKMPSVSHCAMVVYEGHVRQERRGRDSFKGISTTS